MRSRLPESDHMMPDADFSMLVGIMLIVVLSLKITNLPLRDTQSNAI